MNEQFQISLWIALGGSLGTLARFALVHATGIPGTFTVNVLGSFLLATITGWAATKMLSTLWTQYGIAVGFCGAFTTMSTLAADTFAINSPIHAALYLAASLTAGILASFAGFALGRFLCTTITIPDDSPKTP